MVVSSASGLRMMLPKSTFVFSQRRPLNPTQNIPKNQEQMEYICIIILCLGPFTFTYNRGHGECKNPVSNIESCTEDSRMLLNLQACPDVAGTESTGTANRIYFVRVTFLVLCNIFICLFMLKLQWRNSLAWPRGKMAIRGICLGWYPTIMPRPTRNAIDALFMRKFRVSRHTHTRIHSHNTKRSCCSLPLPLILIGRHCVRKHPISWISYNIVSRE